MDTPTRLFSRLFLLTLDYYLLHYELVFPCRYPDGW